MSGIGERLRQVREKLGLSRGPFAAMLGVSLNTVSNWEREVAYPPADKLAILRETHGLDVNWLLTGQGVAEESRTTKKYLSPHPIDVKILGQVISELDDGIARMKIELPPEKKAGLISLLYGVSSEAGKPIGPELVDQYLSLVV